MTVTGKPLTSFPTLTCHCNSCKRRSGGIASYAFVVPKQYVEFHPAPSTALGTDDNAATTTTTTSNNNATPNEVHKVFVDKDTGSGHPMQRTMCAECGSPVCIVEASDPDARCLQFGLFAGVQLEGVNANRTELLTECKPQMEMFARKRVEWMPEIGQDVREKV